MSNKNEQLEALADTLGDAQFTYNEFDPSGEAVTCVKRGTSVDIIAEHILAAGYSKPRTITTAEELDVLRTDSTVRSAQGGVWFKEASGKGCVWTEPGAQWWHWSTDISLPATVLYEPSP